MTGKQLWERGMVGKLDEEEAAQDGEDINGVTEAVEKLELDR